MTVITNNSITGINSITAQASTLNFYDSNGGQISIGASIVGNVTGNATGLSGTPNVNVGVITATGSLKLNGQNGTGKGLKLDLAGSGDYTIQETTANDTVQFGGTGTSNFFRHNVSSGNIGIGTTADATLHVFKAGDGQTPVHFQTGNANGHLYFYNDSNGYSIDSGGDIRFVTNRSSSGTPTRMMIAGNGRVYVNTTSATDFIDDGSKFYVRNSGQCMAIYNDTGSGWNVRHRATNNSGTYYFESFNAGTTGVGGITSDGSTTTYGTTSDYRLKENVEPIAGAVDRLKQLNPRRFNFIAAPERTVDGFLAHEVQDYVPEAVVGEKDAVDEKGEPVYQNIDQSKLVPLLTAALQEAISKIETLEAQNAAILARLDAAGI